METHALQKRIASTLKKAREERRWTQAELAEKLDLSQSRLSEIEQGKGSLSAEQLILVLSLFNLPLHQFLPPAEATYENNLQKALAQFGAKHLKESPQILFTQQQENLFQLICDTITNGNSGRLIASLAPVLVKNIQGIQLRRLDQKFTELGLQQRFCWVVEGTEIAVKKATQHKLSSSIQKEYKLFLLRAGHWLFLKKKEISPTVHLELEDILDTDILSKKTLTEVRNARDALAKRWNIVTRIRLEDFYNALVESEK